MKWIKISTPKDKFKDKIKIIIISISLPLIILSAAIYLGVTVFNLYKQPSNRTFAPVKTINISEPFSGNFYFNDKLGSNDFSDIIIKSIDSAKKTIELAMYSMDSTGIRDALLRADKRGVSVNLLFSNKHETSENKLFKDRSDKVKVKFVGIGNNGYMHNKFLIIDRGQTGQNLFFSSYNFTDIQGEFDPSFIMETTRPEIVGVFGEEFDRLSSNETWRAKKNNTYNPFAALITYPQGYLEIWFPPGSGSNNVKSRMSSLIQNAKSNIKIMIWYLTDKDIASALAIKAKEIPVTIVTDDFNWQTAGSVFPTVSAQKDRQKLSNLQIITDQKRNIEAQKFTTDSSLNSFLHHHLLIVDDQIALFGTNNWSSGGFFKNDESIMVSNISSVVSAFKQSFLYNYNINK